MTSHFTVKIRVTDDKYVDVEPDPRMPALLYDKIREEARKYYQENKPINENA